MAEAGSVQVTRIERRSGNLCPAAGSPFRAFSALMNVVRTQEIIVRDNVAFFQTIRASLVNSSGAGKTAKERDFAVQQIIDQSVVYQNS